MREYPLLYHARKGSLFLTLNKVALKRQTGIGTWNNY